MRVYLNDQTGNYVYEGIYLYNLSQSAPGSQYEQKVVLPGFVSSGTGYNHSVIISVDGHFTTCAGNDFWQNAVTMLNSNAIQLQPIDLEYANVSGQFKQALFMCIVPQTIGSTTYYTVRYGYYSRFSGTGSISHDPAIEVRYRPSSGVYEQTQSTATTGITLYGTFTSFDDAAAFLMGLDVGYPCFKDFSNVVGTFEYHHLNSEAGQAMDAWLLSDEGYDMEQVWNPFRMANFINVYKLGDESDVRNFQNDLWEIDDDGSRTVSNRLYSNPMDCIVGLQVLPFVIPEENLGLNAPIMVGIQQLPNHEGGSHRRVVNEWAEFNFGSKQILREFNDYRDFTEISVQVYLPCIGWKNLDAQLVMGKYVTIKYRVNFITGEILANIFVGDTSGSGDIIDSMQGSAVMTCPISGRDFTSLLQAKANRAGSVVGAIGGTAAGATAGASIGTAILPGVGTAIGAGIGALAGGSVGASKMTAASNEVSKAMNTVQKDGAIGGSSAYLGYDKAYILVMKHNDVNATGYQNYHGYPTNKAVLISSLTGYFKVRDCQIASAIATDEERAEIEEFLKGGCFI